MIQSDRRDDYDAQTQALQHQIEKLTVHASLAGVLLRRSIEPGEVTAPGALADHR